MLNINKFQTVNSECSWIRLVVWLGGGGHKLIDDSFLVII